MITRNWDTAYKQKGELQKDVLPIVKKAAITFKKRRYKKILDFTKDELKGLFLGFSRLRIKNVSERFSDQSGNRGVIDAFDVRAEK